MTAPWTKGTTNRADLSRRVQQRVPPAICAKAVPGGASVQAGDNRALRPRQRALIRVRYVRFAEAAPVRDPFAARFCRKVISPMAEATQQRVGAAPVAGRRPGGHRFIGRSARTGPALRTQFDLAGQPPLSPHLTPEPKKDHPHGPARFPVHPGG
ncbi:hypothetical protein [Pseudooceanicola sp.]|uniref:hypothetical protein n=1 Tax=Pseudooceanicola sp. TaxID=1914328 RepID=UPI0035181ED2